MRYVINRSLQSSHPSHPLFLNCLLPLSSLQLRNLMGKEVIFPLYIFIYISNPLCFLKALKHLKTKAMEKLKHSPSLILILFWLLLWSLRFCFDTSLLEMMKTVNSICWSQEEGKQCIQVGKGNIINIFTILFWPISQLTDEAETVAASKATTLSQGCCRPNYEVEELDLFYHLINSSLIFSLPISSWIHSNMLSGKAHLAVIYH